VVSDILKELKKNNKADAVLIISAKNSLDDKVHGLKAGADDYLTKPFHLPELGARVAAIIRVSLSMAKIRSFLMTHT
jgi:DNA-binding response OmpR family regulator